MPINIDTVYQKVLAVANKEQRGYITPQEFNLFASQAQLDVFEQYFYDINALSRMHGNDTEYSDALELVNEKLSLFKIRSADLAYSSGPGPNQNIFILPSNLYSLGTVVYEGFKEVEPVNENELLHYFGSPLAAPTTGRPVYTKIADGIKVYPGSINSNVACTYLRKPNPAKWSYVVVPTSSGNEKAMYDPVNSTNFELHETEETKIVQKILELAGIMTEEQNLYTSIDRENTQKQIQEKQ
tara:strand:+ start:1070 stop:1792 length:723 start_codon:yes stop_codon:yes gene_type:complete